MSLMQELNEQHDQTFLIVSHDSGVAARCHRTIFMRDGVIEREEAGLARTVASSLGASSTAASATTDG